MPQLELHGTTLNYEDVGSGPAIVFVHAGIADMHQWDAQWDAFAAGYRLIRYDQRGYGLTPFGDTSFAFAEDLLSLLDHLGVERAVLVGCSLGGMAALEFAIVHPHRVQGLVLVGSGVIGFEPVSGPPPEWDALDGAFEREDYDLVVELQLRMLVDGRGRSEPAPPALREYVARYFRRWATETNDYSKLMWLNPPAAGLLHEVAAPTLVVVGALDTEQNVEASEFLAQGIPGARHVVIEGAAHLPNMEFPDEFNALLRAFLAELSL